MHFLKKNYGWMLVVILASLPLFPISNVLNNAISKGLSSAEGKNGIDMLYHISGEFSIRWMTTVLTLTPFFIVFGVQNLFVRQAMGIATAVWSFIHFILFIWFEEFLETFTQFNYVAGFIAILILIPLFLTSNRKAMKYLKTKWKKLQRFAYAAIFLSLLHVAILDKTWLIYAIITGVGFIIRIPIVKHKFIRLRKNRNYLNKQL